MIFPVLELEGVTQIDDKTRLKTNKSFVSADETAITLVEIEPEAGAGFIDVTSAKYLDWQYSTPGTKVVSSRVTTDGAPVTASRDLLVLTEEEDYLFSNDDELVSYEPDLLNYTREGRNSFLDVHRVSQTKILAWLDEHRIWDSAGDKLTKESIVDIDEVKQWSKYMTLGIIFEGLSNSLDDIFHEKSMRYKTLETKARNRGSLKLDLNGDGNIDDSEKLDVRSLRMIRR